MSSNKNYFNYWGKASYPKGEDGKLDKTQPIEYHLLVYHCLDVVAVASIWWDESPSLRRQFCQLTGLSEAKTKALLLFFIAIHDLGKLTILFQLKSISAWQKVNPELAKIKFTLFDENNSVSKYNHGHATVYWLYQDQKERFATEEDDFFDDDNESWEAWFSWIAPVAGHHGAIPQNDAKESYSHADPTEIPKELTTEFKQARLHLLTCLEQLFLQPAGLSLADDPPKLTDVTMLAGFCAVCDWIGSCADDKAFIYKQQPPEDNNLSPYFESRLAIAKTLLTDFGLIKAKVASNASILSLLDDGCIPRPMQQLITKLPVEIGTTIIEAATGSGKTEAALLYAWILLENNLADSIVFALPTQATANCMLERIEKLAKKIFSNFANIILRHGLAKHQQRFINLKDAVKPTTEQKTEEAWVQCASWLAESKKRVFLGQIGICTVDQVLVSVLPIKHKFVRGFGISRSVLIIDEVHAYDQYMYGLLEAVLQQQQQNYSATILLSATLPEYQKQQLLCCWHEKIEYQQKQDFKKISYPLISFCSNTQIKTLDINNLDNPITEQVTSVKVELQKTDNMLPNDELLDRIILAAEKGAQIAIVCNLVSDSQQIFAKLTTKAKNKLSDEQLILFHSRYSFNDRQAIETKVINTFGTAGARKKGHILVSTQVFECSIDADVDWMITQLCPVDSLFQRWGRLHRHEILRILGFKQPLCTILLPTNNNYELHELIYGSARILWRTQQLLEECNNQVDFPTAYREWIEKVYQQDNWGNETDEVIKSHEEFIQEQASKKICAKGLTTQDINEFHDTDSNVAALTRDGEMSLTIVPRITNDHGIANLLDGTPINSLDKSNKFEKLSLNSINVPATWNKNNSKGQLPDEDENAYIWLDMDKTAKGYQCAYQQTTYNYSSSLGFSRIKG